MTLVAVSIIDVKFTVAHIRFHDNRIVAFKEGPVLFAGTGLRLKRERTFCWRRSFETRLSHALGPRSIDPLRASVCMPDEMCSVSI